MIGALGGSRTRAFARILRHAGVFMGSRLNEAEDSRPFIEFYDAWGPACLEAGGGFPDDHRKSAQSTFLECLALARHLADLPRPDAPWGVKVPRNLLFTRLWIELFPDLRFIHVIRHGLDMAYSGDTNQLRLYGDLVLTPEERGYARKLQAIAYWSRVNLAAASFGERDLGDRYLRLRFEDLCVDPVRRVSEIFDFLGVRDRSRLAAAAAEVRPPSTIGRWHAQPAIELKVMMKVGRPALERFHYWHDAAWNAVRSDRS